MKVAESAGLDAMPEATSLIGFTLPGTPFSVQMARFYVQSALRYYGLGGYARDVETVTSELVSNAIKHAGARAINLELMRLAGSGAVVVVVDDPSPDPPVMRDLADNALNANGELLRLHDAYRAAQATSTATDTEEPPTPHGTGRAQPPAVVTVPVLVNRIAITWADGTVTTIYPPT